MSLNERLSIQSIAASDYERGTIRVMATQERQEIYYDAYGLLYQLGEIDSARSAA